MSNDRRPTLGKLFDPAIVEDIRDMMADMDPDKLTVAKQANGPDEFFFEGAVVSMSDIPPEMVDKVKAYMEYVSRIDLAASRRPVERTPTVKNDRPVGPRLDDDLSRHNLDFDDEEMPPPSSPKVHSDMDRDETEEAEPDDESEEVVDITLSRQPQPAQSTSATMVPEDPPIAPVVTTHTLPPDDGPQPPMMAQPTPAPVSPRLLDTGATLTPEDLDSIGPLTPIVSIKSKNRAWEAEPDEEVEDSPTTGSRHHADNAKPPPPVAIAPPAEKADGVHLRDIPGKPEPLDQWFVGHKMGDDPLLEPAPDPGDISIPESHAPAKVTEPKRASREWGMMKALIMIAVPLFVIGGICVLLSAGVLNMPVHGKPPQTLAVVVAPPVKESSPTQPVVTAPPAERPVHVPPGPAEPHVTLSVGSSYQSDNGETCVEAVLSGVTITVAGEENIVACAKAVGSDENADFFSQGYEEPEVNGDDIMAGMRTAHDLINDPFTVQTLTVYCDTTKARPDGKPSCTLKP